MNRYRRLVLAAVTIPAACSAARRTEPPLRLDYVHPDSLPISALMATPLILGGAGFDTDTVAGNSIDVGPVTIDHVRANETGTVLRFTIPAPRRVGRDAPPIPMPAGTYSVVVRTRSGTSNARSLRVIP